MLRRIALPLVFVVVAGVATTAATARTARPASAVVVRTTDATAPLYTGLQDPVFWGPQQATAFAMTDAAGATYVRVYAEWDLIAPTTLPGAWDPTNPSDSHYNWAALDAIVSSAVAHGLKPILNIVRPAPSWGYSTPPNGWYGGTPDINALGAFATALAKRYDGIHGPAPAVRAFSVWNEPNFSRNLYPQKPEVYRAMVNAVADSVHAVNANNLVLAGELAPFKHTPTPHDKNAVIPPLTFIKNMLCLSGTSASAGHTCAAQGEFDVWAHHPYSDTGPFGHAIAGGVELGDLPKMDALITRAQQVGAIASAHDVQFWVTEFGWSSNPPNSRGVPMKLQTRWMAESLYQIWNSGATVGINFLLQDLPLTTPFQSGLYLTSTLLSSAQEKPILSPFEFPFVAYLKGKGKVNIWGRDATNDKRDVDIQRRIGAGGSWVTVATITSNSRGVFQASLLPISAAKNWWLRAHAPGSGDSTPFALKVPANENKKVNPFPLNG